MLGEIAERTLGNDSIDWSKLRNLGNIRAAIAAVIPLLLWIAGVYDLLRNIRF
jgi:hypothetical protein